jgi:excisionase family DNA binding protein
MSMKTGVEYLTVIAAAKYLGVSRDKLSRMIRDRQLEVVENPLDGRQRLIARSELDALKPPGRIITDPEQLQPVAPPPALGRTEKTHGSKKKKKASSKAGSPTGF